MSACVAEKGGGFNSPSLNREICVAGVGVGGWLGKGRGIEQQCKAIEGKLVAAGDSVVSQRQSVLLQGGGKTGGSDHSGAVAIKNLPKMGDAQLPEGEKCRFRKVSVDTKL